MYRVVPKGLNTKQNDRDVGDGFLEESINLQWRDGVYRPIPERLSAQITDSSGKQGFIMHKVSDEDKINVLMFDAGLLKWFGTIENGIYTAKTLSVVIPGFVAVNDFSNLSFTILNSIIYLMSSSQEFYYSIQFDETTETYESKNIYAWKDLIAFFPNPVNNAGQVPKGDNTNHLLTRCGVVLIRFTLVLKTGEEVLHSPIYSNLIYSINRSEEPINKDDLLTNIHAVISTNVEFSNQTIYDEEISAINFYASIPYYLTRVDKDYAADLSDEGLVNSNDIKGEVRRMAEQPFYLVKTIDKPSVNKFENSIMLYAGFVDIDLDYEGHDLSKVNFDTIAAGQVMPVDNFSYHKLFGSITSINGRLAVNNPKTVLSIGHIRSLALSSSQSKVGFRIDTEDGNRNGVAYQIDKNLTEVGGNIRSRGILSYPDSRANFVGGNSSFLGAVRLYKSRANAAHNMSCAFNFATATLLSINITEDTTDMLIQWSIPELVIFGYGDGDAVTSENPPLIGPVFYTSENRVQFSASGEFSLWPAINSYRVGEGRIVFVGSNSVDPANSDFIAPLLIGTSDGIYTVNFDPSGLSFIQSITRAASLPAISSENIQIDQALVYVSDKGLIVINNGRLDNISIDHFPEQGGSSFPIGETVYPNYNALTFFENNNPFILDDIVDYLKGSVFAYDGRRNNLWCSNALKNFSLVYNLNTKQWDMSTYTFQYVIDFNSTLNTSQGDIFSRLLVINMDGDFDILSGENPNLQVNVHLLTRSIKMQSHDQYKKIDRLISRCELYRSDINGYFSFGVWGRQDLSRTKVSIPIAAFRDGSSASFPNNVRQDIPVGKQKGKYKTITILQSGNILPNSSLNGFDIVASPVDNNILR